MADATFGKSGGHVSLTLQERLDKYLPTLQFWNNVRCIKKQQSRRVFLIFILVKIFYKVQFWLCVSLCVGIKYSAHRGQEKASDALEQQL